MAVMRPMLPLLCLLLLGPVARAETAWPTKAWPVSTPEEQGLDSGELARVIESVGSAGQDSLLVVRHGHLVLDVSYAPYEAGIAHDLRSITKSVIGTLTAMALQDGLLDTVDHPVLTLFPDIKALNSDDSKKAMTVQHLLDMTSGLKWEERAYTPNETLAKMYASPDPTSFVLNQPMADPPGNKFYYSGGNPYVLSALITERAKQSAAEFAKRDLFPVLGITSARWLRPADRQGVTDGESGLFLTPQDMARIGYLYLHDGMWDSKQLLPPGWVARIRESKLEANFGLHYANLWWSLPEKDAFMALGRHSQLILVLPKLDIVVVMTGALRDDEYYAVSRLIDNIARTVRADTPVPVDPVAKSFLAAAIRHAETEQPSAVGETSAVAQAISGKTYRFDANKAGDETIRLDLTGPTPSWTLSFAGEPGQPSIRATGPIGLDGIYRKNRDEGRGIDAVKGRWLSEHSFVVDDRMLGEGGRETWELTFDGDKIDAVFRTTDGIRTEVHGVAQAP